MALPREFLTLKTLESQETGEVDTQRDVVPSGCKMAFHANRN